MGAFIIITGIIAVLLTGLGTIAIRPLNYDLYTSPQVQNMSASALASADMINGMITVGPMVIVGAIFLAMYASTTRSQGVFS